MENNIVNIAETECKKPYELLPLTGEHIIPCVSIIRKIGLNEIKNS